MSFGKKCLTNLFIGASCGSFVAFSYKGFERGRVMQKQDFNVAPNSDVIEKRRQLFSENPDFVRSTLYKASEHDYTLIEVWKNPLALQEAERACNESNLRLNGSNKIVCDVDSALYPTFWKINPNWTEKA